MGEDTQTLSDDAIFLDHAELTYLGYNDYRCGTCRETVPHHTFETMDDKGMSSLLYTMDGMFGISIDQEDPEADSQYMDRVAEEVRESIRNAGGRLGVV